jgi:hypothetical protein
MTSKYSVIQYVPNPISDERINVGVVAFDEKNVKVHFLSRWERVCCFGAAENIDFLRDFAHRMEEAAEAGLLLPGDEAGKVPKHERLTKIAKGWINSIQFTEPRGSLEDIDSLIEDIAKTYLLEIAPERCKRYSETLSTVARKALKSIEARQPGDHAWVDKLAQEMTSFND